MGTNYYIKKVTTKEEREELKRLIDLSADGSKYSEIIDLVGQFYGRCDEYDRGAYTVHLGKNSGGWKFLWNPNITKVYNGHYDDETNTWVEDKPTYDKKYELTKDSIREFVMREGHVLVDEYGEVQDKEEFLKWAFEKEGLDSITYREKQPEEKVYYNERQKIWRELGFKFNDWYQFDFESDGLRFSTSIDFC